MPSIGRFIFSLLVAFYCLIASCLLLWTSSSPAGGTWEAANGKSSYQAHHHHHPSEEAYHQLPPWRSSAAAVARPGAGETPESGGNISCQGDSQDEASLQLLAWMASCLLAYFLWRCAKHGWIMFVLMVRAMWEAKRRERHDPPAPVPGADDMEGAPANLVEPVPGAPVLAANGVEEPPANLAAVVLGSDLPLSLRPPNPLPGRSISAPERLISRPVIVTAENNTISRDVGLAALASAAPSFSAASRGRARTVGHHLSFEEEFCATV
ncbi:unnamed protein product [Ectocarpus sp. CCAP 1310/34]|nr:unnamed protein product [Ectocarpus sp. CCAP 1310/34]